MKVNCFGDNKNYIDNKIKTLPKELVKTLPKELVKKLPHELWINIFNIAISDIVFTFQLTQKILL